jgi:hypothetical protein
MFDVRPSNHRQVVSLQGVIISCFKLEAARAEARTAYGIYRMYLPVHRYARSANEVLVSRTGTRNTGEVR